MVSKALIIFAIKRAHLAKQLMDTRTVILRIQIRMAQMEQQEVTAGSMKLIREKLNFFRSLEHRRTVQLKAFHGSYQTRAH